MSSGLSSTFEEPELNGVEDLLGSFLAPDGLALTEVECSEGLVALDRLRNMTDAAMCAGIDRFDSTQIYGGDAMRSTVAWLRSRTELSHGQASQLIHRARALRVMPVVQDAYRQGLIGTAKVDALVDAREGVEELFAEQEEALVDAVQRLNVKQTRNRLARWRRVALASVGRSDDGPEPDPEDTNRLHCSPSLDGRHKVDADLDAESGEKLLEALNAEIDAMFRTGAVHAEDGYRRSRLLAMAHAAVIERGALPGTRAGRPRPSVRVNIDLAELLGLPVDGPEHIWARTCELASGLAINRAAADRLMCEADITAVLTETGLDGIVTPLGATHHKRYPTANERAALAQRDQGCVYPGCEAPVDRTDAHHLDPWHLHHRTELDRLVLLCGFHHRAVHDGGHHLERSPRGVITVIRPDGTQLGPIASGQLVIEPEPPPDSPGHGTSPPNIRPPTRFRPLAQRRTLQQRDQLRERNYLVSALRVDARRIRARRTKPDR